MRGVPQLSGREARFTWRVEIIPRKTPINDQPLIASATVGAVLSPFFQLSERWNDPQILEGNVLGRAQGFVRPTSPGQTNTQN
jgi:hypothetical protein